MISPFPPPPPTITLLSSKGIGGGATYQRPSYFSTLGADGRLIFLISERPLLVSEAPYKWGRKRLMNFGRERGSLQKTAERRLFPGTQDVELSDNEETDRCSVC